VKKLLILLGIGLSSCVSGVEMKSVHYEYLLNDGNSKVWMIDQMIVGNTNVSAYQAHEKELLIFFQNGRFQYIPVKELGHKTGLVGNYFLDSEEKELKLYFKEDIWQFKMEEISEDSIYLVPLKESDANFSMQLVPLKELFFE